MNCINIIICIKSKRNKHFCLNYSRQVAILNSSINNWQYRKRHSNRQYPYHRALTIQTPPFWPLQMSVISLCDWTAHLAANRYYEVRISISTHPLLQSAQNYNWWLRYWDPFSLFHFTNTNHSTAEEFEQPESLKVPTDHQESADSEWRNWTWVVERSGRIEVRCNTQIAPKSEYLSPIVRRSVHKGNPYGYFWCPQLRSQKKQKNIGMLSMLQNVLGWCQLLFCDISSRYWHSETRWGQLSNKKIQLLKSIKVMLLNNSNTSWCILMEIEFQIYLITKYKYPLVQLFAIYTIIWCIWF